MEKGDVSTAMCMADFDLVFNRNEGRVICTIHAIIEKEGVCVTRKDIQDIFALSMNRIPAHYVHRGTIVLNSPVSQEDIKEVVRDSMTQVLNQTKP